MYNLTIIILSHLLYFVNSFAYLTAFFVKYFFAKSMVLVKGVHIVDENKKKSKKKWIILGTIATIVFSVIIPSKLAEKSFKNIRFDRKES